MTRLDEILALYDFNTWAGTRMFQATAALSAEELTRDLKSSFPSVRATLIHLVGAEWVWLMRLQGASPLALPEGKSGLDHEQIAQWWHQIDEERHAFLQTLTEESLDRQLAYTNFAGIEYVVPLWQMLRHLANHSTYHRGQVVTMLRQLGHQAPATDMILMFQTSESRSGTSNVKAVQERRM